MGTYQAPMLDTIRRIVWAFLFIPWSIAWLTAPATMDKLKRVNPRIRHLSWHAFRAHEVFLSHLFSEQRMKILFSQRQDFEKYIKEGFCDSPHEIAFKDLPPNIKEYDLVVPLSLGDLKYLHTVRDLMINNPIPIPSLECISLCDDKYLLNKSLEANGFGHFLPKVGGALTYPYILKKRIDEGGRNSHLISDKQQEQALSDVLTHPEYFSQSFMRGSYEYATHILFKNRRIVHSINIEYKFSSETPIKGKDKPIYTMICHCPYLDLFSNVLRSIGFNGLCCINYKVCDNHPFILEINPRFGGSLCSFFFSFIRHAA